MYITFVCCIADIGVHMWEAYTYLCTCVLIGAHDWVEGRREERLQEFAPPQMYMNETGGHGRGKAGIIGQSRTGRKALDSSLTIQADPMAALASNRNAKVDQQKETKTDSVEASIAAGLSALRHGTVTVRNERIYNSKHIAGTTSQTDSAINNIPLPGAKTYPQQHIYPNVGPNPPTVMHQAGVPYPSWGSNNVPYDMINTGNVYSGATHTPPHTHMQQIYGQLNVVVDMPPDMPPLPPPPPPPPETEPRSVAAIPPPPPGTEPQFVPSIPPPPGQPPGSEPQSVAWIPPPPGTELHSLHAIPPLPPGIEPQSIAGIPGPPPGTEPQSLAVIPPPPGPPPETKCQTVAGQTLTSEVYTHVNSALSGPQPAHYSALSGPQPAHYSSGPTKVQRSCTPRYQRIHLHKLPASLPAPPTATNVPSYPSMDDAHGTRTEAQKEQFSVKNWFRQYNYSTATTQSKSAQVAVDRASKASNIPFPAPYVQKKDTSTDPFPQVEFDPSKPPPNISIKKT